MNKYSHRPVEIKEIRKTLSEEDYDVDYVVEKFDYRLTRKRDGKVAILHKEKIYFLKPEDLHDYILGLFEMEGNDGEEKA